MAYPYVLPFPADPGLTLTAEVRDTDDTALASQPAYTITELDDGLYTYYTAAMPAGHVGWVAILNGAVLVSVGGVTPGESEAVGLDGVIPFTYTVYEEDGSTPLEGASVYVSTDVGGTNRSAVKVTDAFGQVTFNLSAATYYFWRSHPEWNFTNPDSEVVS